MKIVAYNIRYGLGKDNHYGVTVTDHGGCALRNAFKPPRPGRAPRFASRQRELR